MCDWDAINSLFFFLILLFFLFKHIIVLILLHIQFNMIYYITLFNNIFVPTFK